MNDIHARQRAADNLGAALVAGDAYGVDYGEPANFRFTDESALGARTLASQGWKRERSGYAKYDRDFDSDLWIAPVQSGRGRGKWWADVDGYVVPGVFATPTEAARAAEARSGSGHAAGELYRDLASLGFGGNAALGGTEESFGKSPQSAAIASMLDNAGDWKVAQIKYTAALRDVQQRYNAARAVGNTRDAIALLQQARVLSNHAKGALAAYTELMMGARKLAARHGVRLGARDWPYSPPTGGPKGGGRDLSPGMHDPLPGHKWTGAGGGTFALRDRFGKPLGFDQRGQAVDVTYRSGFLGGGVSVKEAGSAEAAIEQAVYAMYAGGARRFSTWNNGRRVAYDYKTGTVPGQLPSGTFRVGGDVDLWDLREDVEAALARSMAGAHRFAANERDAHQVATNEYRAVVANVARKYAVTQDFVKEHVAPLSAWKSMFWQTIQRTRKRR